MEEAATPALALVVTGLFLGFGLAGLAAWLAESEWGTGLLTVLVGFAPLAWVFVRPGILREGGGEEGIRLTGDESTLLASLVVGLVLGILMIRASGQSASEAPNGP